MNFSKTQTNYGISGANRLKLGSLPSAGVAACKMATLLSVQPGVDTKLSIDSAKGGRLGVRYASDKPGSAAWSHRAFCSKMEAIEGLAKSMNMSIAACNLTIVLRPEKAAR